MITATYRKYKQKPTAAVRFAGIFADLAKPNALPANFDFYGGSPVSAGGAGRLFNEPYPTLATLKLSPRWGTRGGRWGTRMGLAAAAAAGEDLGEGEEDVEAVEVDGEG